MLSEQCAEQHVHCMVSEVQPFRSFLATSALPVPEAESVRAQVRGMLQPVPEADHIVAEADQNGVSSVEPDPPKDPPNTSPDSSSASGLRILIG